MTVTTTVTTTNPKIEVREATPADHPTFARLFLELGVDDPVMDAERFEAEMVKTTIIAMSHGSIAGYAHFRPMKESTHLSQIVTAEDARRMGVGRALMTEVIARAKGAGSTTLTLNVLPKNVGAIALYESFGLTRAFTSRALRIDWALVDALAPSMTPYVRDARVVDPNDDERLEQATRLARGILAEQRARPGRVLLMIEREPGRIAVSIFDTTFPGAYPFRAPDGEHALSLVRALRPHANPSDLFLNIFVEDQPAVADVLIAAGARLRLETMTMRGPI